MSDFYDGTRLLSMMDIRGKPPEMYYCQGNRTAGKTFYGKRLCVRKAKRTGMPSGLIVRTIDDVPGAYDAFWADVGPIVWPGQSMTQIPLLGGKAGCMILGGAPVCYVIPLNNPQRIKRNSAKFSDMGFGFFDEFALEEGRYLPDEIGKFNSVRVSIARGGAKGTHTRHVPILMVANAVTNYSPYHTYFGLNKDLQPRTRFKRGKGWVLEQAWNEAAAEALEEEFASIHQDEMNYMARNEFLLDKKSFVDKVPGAKVPLCCIRYGGVVYSCWCGARCPIFVSSKLIALDVPVYAGSVDDHAEDTALMERGTDIYKIFRKAYSFSNIRFSDQGAKQAIMAVLQINK